MPILGQSVLHYGFYSQPPQTLKVVWRFVYGLPDKVNALRNFRRVSKWGSLLSIQILHF